MPPVVAAGFNNWLKTTTNMKLVSDVSVTRVNYEGITNFESLRDFDDDSIAALPRECRRNIPAVQADPANGIAAEPEVLGGHISATSVQRLQVAVKAAKYYHSIGRTLTVAKMHYTNILANFKIEHEAYKKLRNADNDTKVPKINDRDSDRKIIRWAPVFADYLSRCFGATGPLRYVIRDEPTVPTEVADPLLQNSYHGASGSLIEELTARLPHTGPIYRNDNKTVYMKIEEAVRGTSVESTIKSFSRTKDGRGAYLALVANHAGDVKYRGISKKRLNFLQNVKWNGRSYPLETHVTNHRTAFDDLRDCNQHVAVPVPTDEQRVEFLIDSITSTDTALQAAIGLIRADTNNMRSNFELASSSLIEVDPYRRSNRSTNNNNRSANVSAIDFHAGRGETGVDLRWHHPKEFKALNNAQKDELCSWLKTEEGKKSKAESKKAMSGKKRKDGGNGDNGSWKKKLKQKMKTKKGLASVMSVLKEQEESNEAFIAALRSLMPTGSTDSAGTDTVTTTHAASSNANASALAAALPATSITLRSILKNGKK